MKKGNLDINIKCAGFCKNNYKMRMNLFPSHDGSLFKKGEQLHPQLIDFKSISTEVVINLHIVGLLVYLAFIPFWH